MAIIVILLMGRPTWASLAIGLSLVAAGEAVRVWAAGYIRKCVEVTAGGPFGWVRNPLYLGSFLVTLGYCVMAGRPVLAAVVMLIFCVFHVAAVFSEEQYLTCLFGAEFLAYCKAVPRFFPRGVRHRGTERFSARLVFENREHVSVICAAVVAAVFALHILFR